LQNIVNLKIRFMVSLIERLEEISRKVELPHSSIKEVSDLYFEAKNAFFGDEETGTSEGLIAANIFQKSYSFVYGYLTSKGMKILTDEELDLLLVLCDEASANFEYLTEVFSSSSNARMSSLFTKEDNEENQKDIQDCRERVLEEKAKRKVQQDQQNQNNKSKFEDKVNNEKKNFQDESWRIKISELEKRIENLKSKNKTADANRLQKRVNEIKKNSPTNPTNPKKDDSFPVRNFLIGGGIILLILMVPIGLVLAVKNNKKKST